nr:PPC domain-containing DNA-binding protein [uncultured Dysosmobacter sp.]
MDYRKFGNTYIVRLDKGEEILEQVKALALREHIKLAAIQALGAVNDFTVGVFDTVEKQYHANSFQGTYEIVSLTGTIDTMKGDFYCHLHMSAGDGQGHVVGGHLNRAVISATCEMVVTEIPGAVDREFSQEIGLNLLKFE